MLTMYMTWWQIILAAGGSSVLLCLLRLVLPESTGDRERFKFAGKVAAASLVVVIGNGQGSCDGNRSSGDPFWQYWTGRPAVTDFHTVFCFHCFNTRNFKTKTYDVETMTQIEKGTGPGNRHTLLTQGRSRMWIMVPAGVFLIRLQYRNYEFQE